MVMTFESGVWHYICTPMVVSDDGPCGRSGCGVEVEGVVDGLLGRFGAGGFSHMQGAPVGTTEGRGDALLSFRGPAKRVPARTLAGFPQPPSDHLYELVGDDGDEQMSFGADDRPTTGLLTSRILNASSAAWRSP